MSIQDQITAARYWYHRSQKLALKLNFHHWLARLIPKLFVLLVLLALFELFRREIAGPFRWSGSFLLLGLAGITAWAWIEARKHFCSANQALVRLETVLHLHNRLSAAQAGVVPWPIPAHQPDDGYIGNWKLMLMPVLGGLLFLWAAHLIPVNSLKMGTSSGTISEPPEFAQVQSWINALKAEDLIQPEKLQDMQTALDKLRERPAQDWYTQSDLEAANSLKELMAQSMNSLAQDLDQTDHSLQTMREKAENPSGEAGSLKPMQDELRKEGDNLASGNLPLKKELTDQLRGGESAKDKPLSASQLKSLQDRLKKGGLAARTAQKSNGGMSPEMQKAMASSQGHGMGHRQGTEPGPGGVGGGKQSAPLELNPREKTTAAGPMTPVNNDDMSRAALGETLKVSASAHTVDPNNYHGTQTAGTAQVQGSGGEAVWRSTYDPQEADALSRFFK